MPRIPQVVVGAHSEGLATIKATVNEASGRVTGMVEILERQGYVLRQLHEVDSSRTISRTSGATIRKLFPVARGTMR